jgi:hypothetical protein
MDRRDLEENCANADANEEREPDNAPKGHTVEAVSPIFAHVESKLFVDNSLTEP